VSVGLDIQQGIVLLDAFAARLDSPALKMKAVEMQDLWKPDYLLIENKGTGKPRIFSAASQCAHPARAGASQAETAGVPSA
jgi:hypothetical protein